MFKCYNLFFLLLKMQHCWNFICDDDLSSLSVFFFLPENLTPPPPPRPVPPPPPMHMLFHGIMICLAPAPRSIFHNKGLTLNLDTTSRLAETESWRNGSISARLSLQPQPLSACSFYLKGLIGSFYYSQLGFLIKRKSLKRLQANTAETHISIKSKEIKTKLRYCQTPVTGAAFETVYLWSQLMWWAHRQWWSGQGWGNQPVSNAAIKFIKMILKRLH